MYDKFKFIKKIMVNMWRILTTGNKLNLKSTN